MAVTLGIADNNKLWPSGWTAGTGGMVVSGYPTFNANGDANEQNRYVGTDPWGNSAMVWQCTSTGGNDASGGWDTDAFAITNTSLYRFSVWVRRTSSTSGGTFYFGCQTSTGAVTNLSSQAAEGNPYWQYTGTGNLTQNQWYLYTGHVYPVSWAGKKAHPESGIYTVSGKRVGNNAGNTPDDCCWQAGTTTGKHRTYHYYCTDTTTRIEFFDPRVDLCDGTEPSITRLLAGPMGTAGGQGIIFSDGSKVVGGNPGVEGTLVSVQSFGASGTWTWTKPLDVTRVHVKVVGGGGGGAGYCESGGAGGYAESYIDVTGVSTVTVTVGGGGGGVGYYAGATGGGTSSFGSYVSATGGGGANTYSSHSGGFGGSGSGGYVNLQGGAGSGHTNSTGSWPGGRGGWSFFGGGSPTTRNHGHLGTPYPKISYGSAGSGGTGGQTDGWVPCGNTGWPGEPGVVIVYHYK